MLFSSPLFLFLFFPLVVGAYLLCPRPLRNPVLLAASLFFYAWGEPTFIGVVLASALADYVLGGLIDKNVRAEQAWRAKWFVALAVLLNASLLLYFKYFNFGAATLSTILTAAHLTPLRAFAPVALPIGISFIVFEKITYVVDIYKQTGKPARSFFSYLLYVFFFPKLLAGPIIKYHDIAGQMESRAVRLNDVRYGCARFVIGLAKKVLLADTVGAIADAIFKLPHDSIGFGNAWLGLLCFTVQIFFDFSGYSDMAIGMARIVGFRLQENFNAPYTARSFTDFWRRWHISLSTWIREYLYIPLGGSRVSPARTYFNLWFCFFLSGLWHGAHLNFVLWGIYHGVFLALDKLFWLKIEKKLPAFVSVPLTFLGVMVGWVIFRADSRAQMGAYFSALVSPSSRHGGFVYVTPDLPFALIVGLVLAFAPLLLARFTASKPENNAPAPFWVQAAQIVGLVLLLVISLCRISNATFAPFLYFRF